MPYSIEQYVTVGAASAWEPVPEGDFPTAAAAIAAMQELEESLGWRDLRVVDEDDRRVLEQGRPAPATDEEMCRAVLDNFGADVREDNGCWYIPNLAPESSDYGGNTEPGSEWDEECDRILACLQEALPPGWSAEWVDDDIHISRIDDA